MEQFLCYSKTCPYLSTEQRFSISTRVSTYLLSSVFAIPTLIPYSSTELRLCCSKYCLLTYWEILLLFKHLHPIIYSATLILFQHLSCIYSTDQRFAFQTFLLTYLLFAISTLVPYLSTELVHCYSKPVNLLVGTQCPN